MLTGKQRAYLKGLAHELDPMVFIGKNELTEATLNEMDAYLTAHELLKVKLQESVLTEPKVMANEAAAQLDAEYVQVIGRKFVLYRENPEKKTIFLPK